MQSADAVTYASAALIQALPEAPPEPQLWIPHPRRHRTAAAVRSYDGSTNIGFFGTVRSHKGFDSLTSLVRSQAGYRLHVFAQSIAESVSGSLGDRLVEHSALAPLDVVYGEVDVVAIPQSDARGADVQLPAKLLDAMSFGMPIVTSRTPSIMEAAADAVVYVDDWQDVGAARDGIESAVRSGPFLRAAAQKRFDEALSLESVVPRARTFFDRLVEEDDRER